MEEKTIEEYKKENAFLSQKLDVITSVLAAKPIKGKTAELLEEFKRLTNEDFIKKFAAKEETLCDDAQVLSDLQKLASDIEDIIKFPMLLTKHIVAVAGGFSSGKSKFLNTFFKDDEIKLSVGIKPVTAIPAFVMSGNAASVTTFTRDGRRGMMLPAVFSKIDHEFIESLGFNLKDIMPYMTVEVPFEEKFSELTHICLIDTPGYNPGKTEETEGDIEAAFEALKDASAVIWFVDIEAGTLPDSDVDFLTKVMASGDKKIYIVVSKADKKESQIQKVIEQIKSVAEDNDIKIEGISAFSANRKKEYLDEDLQTSVFDFLKKQNADKSDIIDRYKKLCFRIEKLFDRYKVSIKEDLERIKKAKKGVIDMRIQIEKKLAYFEEKLSETSSSSNYYAQYKKNRGNNRRNESSSNDDFELEIDRASLIHDRSNQDNENLNLCHDICAKMKNCVKNIFKELNPDTCRDIESASKKKFCGKCGTPLAPDAKFCPECGMPAD